MIELIFSDDGPPAVLHSPAVLYSPVSFALPPAEFDRDYPNMVIEFTSTGEVAQRCGNGGKAQACVLLKPNYEGDKCFVLMPVVGPGGVSPGTQKLLRRHEAGHCNGWEHK